MHGGAAVLQLRGQGTVPMFRLSGLNGCIILLRYAENEPRGSNSYRQGILEGEMPKRSLKAYAPSSARLFRGDPARFYLALTPGRRWERVDRCEQREPHPCYGGGCQAFCCLTPSWRAAAVVPLRGL